MDQLDQPLLSRLFLSRVSPLTIYIDIRNVCNKVSICEAYTPVFVCRHDVLSLGYTHRTDGLTEMYVMNKHYGFCWCNYRVFDKEGNEPRGCTKHGEFHD